MKWKIIIVLFILVLFSPALAQSQTMGKYRGKLDRPVKDSSRNMLGGAAEEDKQPFSTAPEDQKSTADIQRDEQIKQLKMQASQKKEEQRLASDSKYYFEKKIQGNYGLLDGKPARLELVAGKVLQILNGKTIVLSQTHTKYFGGGNYQIEVRDAPIVVVLTNTQGIVDGMFFRQKVTPIGTYAGTTTVGTVSTVVKYTPIPDITYDQYLDLKAKGILFSDK